MCTSSMDCCLRLTTTAIITIWPATSQLQAMIKIDTEVEKRNGLVNYTPTKTIKVKEHDNSLNCDNTMSTCSTSYVNLLSMRPIGFVSKYHIGACLYRRSNEHELISDMTKIEQKQSSLLTIHDVSLIGRPFGTLWYHQILPIEIELLEISTCIVQVLSKRSDRVTDLRADQERSPLEQ